MNRNFTKLYELPTDASEKEASVAIIEGTLLRDDNTDSVLARLRLQCKGEKPVKKVIVSVQALNGSEKAVGAREEAVWDRTEEEDPKEECGEIEIMLPWTAHSFTAEIKEIVFTVESDGVRAPGDEAAGTEKPAPEAEKRADPPSPDTDPQGPSEEETGKEKIDETAGTDADADSAEETDLKKDDPLTEADEAASESEKA
ncbi:MAG: hypothetical protein J6P48_01520, partial [Oscillospiraceae bacterium]|nr:hypothetical protein [Oscillospiraceae bacterium]